MEKAELIIDLVEQVPRHEMPALSPDFLSGPAFDRFNEIGNAQALSGDEDDGGVADLRDEPAEHQDRWLLPWG